MRNILKTLLLASLIFTWFHPNEINAQDLKLNAYGKTVSKVVGPEKQVKDSLLIKNLQVTGIDKDYVELERNFSATTLGEQVSQVYYDRISGERCIKIGQVPQITNDGRKIIPKWLRKNDTYINDINEIDVKITNTRVDVNTHFGKDSVYHYDLQLFLDDVEVLPTGDSRILKYCPFAKEEIGDSNTVEIDYGVIAKRWIRITEGRMADMIVFDSNPGKEIKIKHNCSAKGVLKTGWLESAIDSSDGGIVLVETQDDGDIEIISKEVLTSDMVRYPIYIHAEANTGNLVTTCDGYVYRTTEGTWSELRNGAGEGAANISTSLRMAWINCSSTTNRYEYFARCIINFNTAAIPDDAKLTRAYLYFFVINIDDDYPWSPVLQLRKATNASTTEVFAADYSTITGALVESKDIESITDDQYNYHYLNTAGELAGVNLTGVSKWGWRWDIDYNNQAPTWGAQDDTEVTSRSTDYAGTDYDPYLIVYYYRWATVTTNNATGVQENQATMNGNITSVGSANCTWRGFQYGKTTGYELGDYGDSGSFGTGTYNKTKTDLDAGTLYYFRAKATNEAGTVYGAQKNFTTLSAGIDLIVDTKDGAADLGKIDGKAVADINKIDGKP